MTAPIVLELSRKESEPGGYWSGRMVNAYSAKYESPVPGQLWERIAEGVTR